MPVLIPNCQEIDEIFNFRHPVGAEGFEPSGSRILRALRFCGSIVAQPFTLSTPAFVGTRVPFQTLLDDLEAGEPLAEFLDDFPTVSRDQAVAAFEQAKEALFARARPA